MHQGNARAHGGADKSAHSCAHGGTHGGTHVIGTDKIAECSPDVLTNKRTDSKAVCVQQRRIRHRKGCRKHLQVC